MNKCSVQYAPVLARTADSIDVDLLERTVARSKFALQIPGYKLLRHLARKRRKAQKILGELVDHSLRYVKYLHRSRSLVCTCDDKHLVSMCNRCREFHEQIKRFVASFLKFVRCPRLSEMHFPVDVFSFNLALTYIQARA